MNRPKAATRRAALAAFLLFAAALLAVSPAEASRTTTDARSNLAPPPSLALVEPTASVEPAPRFGFAADLGLLDPERGPGGFVLFAVETSRCELTYARNNPLRYVDPDGRLNYEALLFGQKVPVRVDDRLSKKQQLALKKKLDAALHKLNSGKALTKEEVATIRNVKSIAVDGSARRSSILESTGAFTLIPGDVRDSSASFLGSSLAHDAKHVELFQQGGLRLSRGLGAEVDAMKFQLQVGEKIGISSEEAGYLRDLIRDPKRLEQYIWTSP